NQLPEVQLVQVFQSEVSEEDRVCNTTLNTPVSSLQILAILPLTSPANHLLHRRIRVEFVTSAKFVKIPLKSLEVSAPSLTCNHNHLPAPWHTAPHLNDVKDAVCTRAQTNEIFKDFGYQGRFGTHTSWMWGIENEGKSERGAMGKYMANPSRKHILEHIDLIHKSDVQIVVSDMISAVGLDTRITNLPLQNLCIQCRIRVSTVYLSLV
ncbi:hypothetical protein DFH29DRAFT_882759, partial [Suillus ampliporus]